MTFLNPILAAVGLGCVAIPILIHILMRRRRRPIAWGAMRFLIEAYRKQRRRMNLEQILLLASRCLLVALLALAVGKPIFDAAGARTTGARTVYILLDNSLTSSLAHASGTALDDSKARAIALLRTLDAGRGDTAALVTLAGPADRVVLPASSDLGGVIEAIRQAPACASRTDLAGALALIRDDLASPDRRGEGEVVIALASELRAGSADLETSLTPLDAGTRRVRVLTLGHATTDAGNIALAGVEPLRSVVLAGEEGSAATPVRVSLRRFGPLTSDSQATRVTIEARPAGQKDAPPIAAATGIVRWTPGQESASLTLSLDVRPPRTAMNALVLHTRIDTDDLPRDDEWQRPITSRRRLDVGVIEPRTTGAGIDAFSPGDWWTLALAPRAVDALSRDRGGELACQRIDPAQIVGPGGETLLRGLDAIIVPSPDLLDAGVWRLIARACETGALVIVSPPPGVETHAWSDAMREAMGLEWTLPRTPAEVSEGVSIVPADVGQRGSDLLGLIAPELGDLLRPVRVTRLLAPEGDATRYETVLGLSDGRAFVVAATPGFTETSGRGALIYIGAAIDPRWTDLPTKPLMVPLAQELVRQGVGRSLGASVSVAGAMVSLPVGATELVHLGEEARALTLEGRAGVSVRRAGIYAARDARGTTLRVIGVTHDPAGSSTRALPRERLESWLSPLGVLEAEQAGEASAAPRASADPTPPWSMMLLALALGVACVELAMARFFSHALADDRAKETTP